MSAPILKWQFPEKLGFLLDRGQWRYKIAKGGRDGAKSWSFTRALLALGSLEPLRIGCFREVQRSIKDSVHKLLSDQIQQMGLGGCYDVLQHEIRGRNGTEIVFSGLSTQTRESIKSFEGLDIGFIEEAQNVSKRSWDILEPTIRKPNSELWAAFNPDMDTDFMWQQFVVNPPPDAKVVTINWNDNPWRSKVLDAARERMRVEAPEDYEHIYGGACRPAVEGAIYYKEVSQLRTQNRLCNVPYDPMLKVHVVVDLGFNDFMSFLFVQRLGSEIRIIRYLEDRLRFIPSYHQEMTGFKYNYGTLYLPHDGKAVHLTSNNQGSAEDQFTKLGWTVEIVDNLEQEQGIRKAREIFPRILIDKTHASELLNRLGRYRRRVNAEGQASTPVHDDESHGADGFRYTAIVADQMSNDTAKIPANPYGSFKRAYG